MWHVYSHCIVDSTKNGGNIPPIFKFIIKYSKEGKAWGRGTSSLGDHRLHGGEAQGRENQGTRVLGGPWLYLPSWSLGREGRQLSNGNEATAWARSCGLFPGNQVEHRLREPQKLMYEDRVSPGIIKASRNGNIQLLLWLQSPGSTEQTVEKAGKSH